MSEWQPITKKADATEDANGNTPGYLCLYADGKQPEEGYRHMVANGAWLNARGAAVGITHWMPLPAPPNP